MKLRQIIEILNQAPDIMKNREYIGAYLHNPRQLGVLLKPSSGGPNEMWTYDANDDPPWSLLDESRIPPE